MQLRVVQWWCYGGAMVVLWWCYGGAMVVLWWCYGGAMVVLWWCYGGSMVAPMPVPPWRYIMGGLFDLLCNT